MYSSIGKLGLRFRIQNLELVMSDKKSKVSDYYNFDFEKVYKVVKNTLDEARYKAYSFIKIQDKWIFMLGIMRKK